MLFKGLECVFSGGLIGGLELFLDFLEYLILRGLFGVERNASKGEGKGKGEGGWDFEELEWGSHILRLMSVTMIVN